MKKSGVWFILAVVLVLGALCFVAFRGAGGGGKARARVLRLSHITSGTSHWHKGGERFAELLAARTAGRFQVKVYPGGQIAHNDQRTELQMVQSGAIEMSFESPIILALFLKDKRFDAFSMPWLFPDLRTARRACTGELGDVACEWLAKHSLAGIAVGVNGFRQLTNSKRAVRAPDDLKGIKVRVAGSDLFLNTFKLLGANALTMNFGEVFTSLQEGVIDGQENPLAIIYTSKLYEAQKHLTLWNYAFDPIILCVNEGVWKALSPVDQATFRSCAREAMDYQWDYSEKLEAEILADLAAKGVTITSLSAAELSVFREAAQPIYEQLEQSLGTDVVAKWREVVEKASGGAGTKPEKGSSGSDEGASQPNPGDPARPDRRSTLSPPE